MKKVKFLICIMLSALCMATTSCKDHDDDDDNPVTPTVTTLVGKTWTFGYGSHTAIVDFSSSTFVMVADNGDSASGTYSYDGNTFTCSFSGGDDATYNMYCLTKSNSPSSLEGTVWRFEEVYGSRVNSYSIYLYGSTFTLSKDGYSYQEHGIYAYDGNTITVTYDGETLYLKCGTILYEMARNNTNVW